ncbi:MAG: hypothetical protein JWP97_58 [Labilithrix sp.]|nr:hypothetical protein [Labilithrix sp.]
MTGQLCATAEIMKITLSLPVYAAVLASINVLAACGDGGAGQPAKDPTKQETPTKVDPSSVGSPTPEPSGPADGVVPATAGPATPADGGNCKSGNPRGDAKTIDTCLDSCKGLDDTVPPGSRCISAKTSCAMQCRTKFNK